MQLNDSKFYLLARGFTSYEELDQRIKNVLKETAE